MEGTFPIKGALSARKISAKRVSLSWTLRNTLRYSFIKGWIGNILAKAFSKYTGIITITPVLKARARINGEWIDYGVLSYRYITDTGVAFLVDDWDNGGTDFSTMNYHGCGTGTNAENQTDSDLQTVCTTVLNPDSTWQAGTRSQPTANQYRSTGTLTFDGSAAVTEHGLFNQSSQSGDVLWDRSVFAAVNVGSGDSIQFEYTCTVNAGG